MNNSNNHYTNKMKTLSYAIILFWLFLVTCAVYAATKDYNQKAENTPVFIWNDDSESIPMDNTPILLEFGSKNSDTIYIGPSKKNLAEYQFVVTDDSITIKDFGKEVGTIKLEGNLKKLINKHNL